jgi:molybdopterin synthase sulfur carrier subunit
LAHVFIPASLRSLTSGVTEVDVEGGSVRSVIANLDLQFPGIRDRLCVEDRLATGLSVSVDGRVAGLGLYQRVQPNSEIHFVLAIGGG